MSALYKQADTEILAGLTADSTVAGAGTTVAALTLANLVDLCQVDSGPTMPKIYAPLPVLVKLQSLAGANDGKVFGMELVQVDLPIANGSTCALCGRLNRSVAVSYDSPQVTVKTEWSGAANDQSLLVGRWSVYGGRIDNARNELVALTL